MITNVTLRVDHFTEDQIAEEVIARRAASLPVPAKAVLPWTMFAAVARRLNARIEGERADRFTIVMPGGRVVVVGSELPSPGTMLLEFEGDDALNTAMKEVDRAIDGDRVQLRKRTPEARRDYIIGAAQIGAIPPEVAEQMVAAADRADAKCAQSETQAIDAQGDDPEEMSLPRRRYRLRAALLQRALERIAFSSSYNDAEAIALVNAYVELTKAGS